MTTTKTVGIGVLGATGYSGIELIRLLAAHPHARLAVLGARQQAGQPLRTVWPALATATLSFEPEAMPAEEWSARGVEVLFSALPHGVFAARAAEFAAAGIRVIDLSADFRLRDPAEYGRRYRIEHPAPELLSRGVYGLTEWTDPQALAAATLVANPGCYATAILLAALPAVAAGIHGNGPVVASAVSGVSGAGRSPAHSTHFVECGTGASVYKAGEVHAHLGEITQALKSHVPVTAGGAPPVVFSPHLVPMARGILADVAIPLASALRLEDVRAIYADRYAHTPFVRLLDPEVQPATQHVHGSNRCDLALQVVAGGRLLWVFAALDNLIKGAAGQAIQNWNVMQGWPQELGLPRDAWTAA
jgi:N-acetyl-gamma-glutamyl-phosphate reductase